MLVAIAALATAGCLQREYAVDASYEIGEVAGASHDAAGQRTCLAAARDLSADVECPWADTGKSRMPRGILVLDDFYATLGPPDVGGMRSNYEAMIAAGGTPGNMMDHGDPTALAGDMLGGSNVARGSGGNLPDVILPGFGTFWAALGWWNNSNLDDVVDLSTSYGNEDDDPDSEWVARQGARLYSWVDPGATPTWTSFVTPDTSSPDFTYHLQGYTLYMAGAESSDLILFTDGSLAQPIRVTTASDPALTPSADGKPFTARPGSLVDIDDYVALAPAPVESLYAENLASTLNERGTPSFGWCPNGCGLPVATGAEALDAQAGAGYSHLFARAPPEWLADSGSSAAGRRQDFEDAWHGWIDIVPGTRPPGPTRVPNANARLPLAQSALLAPSLEPHDGSSGLTVGPGWFSFDVWTGVWKDLERDGAVGHLGDDAYDGGLRPNGQDYLRSGGEFIGAFPVEQTSADRPFDATLIPDIGWGPGVLLISSAGNPYDVVGTDANANPCKDPRATRAGPVCVRPLDREADVLTMNAMPDFNYGVDGYYRSVGTIFFPEGSPGFKICTPTFHIAYDAGGVPVHDAVFDCDAIAKYQKP